MIPGKYDHEPSDPICIRRWEEKLFTADFILDQSRSGSLIERDDHVNFVQERVSENPKISTGRLSDELDLPRTMIERLLQKDLKLKQWKLACAVFFHRMATEIGFYAHLRF